jgi:hypothetical protein
MTVPPVPFIFSFSNKKNLIYSFMKLVRYNEFISESLTDSVLDLIMEAKISFTDDALNIIKKIDSPLSDKLINLVGKEVDINQNHIDINKKKSDFVFFKPEDKIGRVGKIINSTFSFLDYYLRDLADIPESGIDSKFIPENWRDFPNLGETVQIIKLIPRSEFISYADAILALGVDRDTPWGLKITANQRYGNILNYNDLYLIQWFKLGKRLQTLTSVNNIYTGVDAVKNSEVSVGRFVRALLSKSGESFTDSEIEQFVYKWRSEIEKSNQALERRFKVVSGEDIRKYYNVSMYEKESGSLGSSCMRYDRCSKYLDIYVKNSQVKLLIMFSEEDEEKICGRALLWDIIEYPFSTKVMDRIYTVRTADETLFKEWAINNKYWYRVRQDFHTDTPFNFHKEDGEIEESVEEFSVKLDVGGDYRYYPYMDSFKYYNTNGTLANYSHSEYDYELTDTEGGDGSCDDCGGTGNVECGECDGDGEFRCRECRGSGNVTCEDCDGSGAEECPVCDGDAELDCYGCDGEGKIDCDDCGGEGEIDDEECGGCSGTGKLNCGDCDGGGKRSCYKCDGDGEIICRNCGGDCEVECGDCDGSGEVNCDECGGDGNYDCPSCS